ncbi:MAG: molybdopterin cofactor-binding domain-containing protein [Anaerolineae bacterium]
MAPFVGGGFGCKAALAWKRLTVCIASKVPGRPVKLRLTREEEFFTAFVRQGPAAHFKMGCDKNGKMVAVENQYYWDAGAYTEYGVNITRASGYSGSGSFIFVPNLKIDSRCVYTNHPVGGPMRGFGMPEMHSGLEQCIDELAHAIDGSGRVPPHQLCERRRHHPHRHEDNRSVCHSASRRPPKRSSGEEARAVRSQ